MDIEQIKKNIGLRIRAFRNNHDYTQEQFCEIIELEQPNLSNIETGKTFPDILTLISIMEKGQVEPNLLFGFFNKKFEQYQPIDYEILDMLANLPKESKEKIKSVIELIK